MKRIILIATVLVFCIIFVSCSVRTFGKDNAESIPAYDRFEFRGVQRMEDGTIIYILFDTISNTEYMYVRRGSAIAVNDLPIIDEASHINAPMAKTFDRNMQSHKGPNYGYEVT